MPCSENVPNLDFQRQFPKTSLDELFLMLTFFDNSDFQTFYFTKLCSIFVDSALCLSTKYNNFLGTCSVLT